MGMAALLLSAGVLLSACALGESGESADSGPSQEASREGTDAPGSREGFDWRSSRWNTSGTEAPDGPVYLESLPQGLARENLAGVETGLQCRILGGRLYGLNRFEYPGGTRFYVRWWDGGQDWREVPITLPTILKIQGKETAVSAFDPVSDRELVVFVQTKAPQEGGKLEYLAIRMSLEKGRKTPDSKPVDLLPALRRAGVELSSDRSAPEIWGDGEGFFYVIPREDEGRVLVLDPQGELAEELKGEAGTRVRFACKTPDGFPLFQWYAGGDLVLSGYVPGSGEKAYGRVEAAFGSPMALQEDGYLYCGEAGKLYRWDLCLGEKALWGDYGALGMGEDPLRLGIALTGEGIPVLLDESGEEPRICRVRAGGPSARYNLPNRDISYIMMPGLKGQSCGVRDGGAYV